MSSPVLLAILSVAALFVGQLTAADPRCNPAKINDPRLAKLGKTPFDTQKMELAFRLYGTDNADPIELDSTQPGTLETVRGGEPLVFVTHGYGPNTGPGNLSIVKDAILEHTKVTQVVLVDWHGGAQACAEKDKCYPQAVVNTQVVGCELAVLIQALVENQEVNPSDVHLIGFSLGAHVSSWAANRFREQTYKVKVGRLSGLDPAANVLEALGIGPRKVDADFVDIIHTSAGKGGFGYNAAIGHVDFYPNGGTVDAQPGCPGVDPATDPGSVFCPHKLSIDYYAASVYSCDFPAAKKCSDAQQAMANECAGNLLVPHMERMGWYATKFPGGIYTLDTTVEQPFCENANGSPLDFIMKPIMAICYNIKTVLGGIFGAIF